MGKRTRHSQRRWEAPIPGTTNLRSREIGEVLPIIPIELPDHRNSVLILEALGGELEVTEIPLDALAKNILAKTGIVIINCNDVPDSDGKTTTTMEKFLLQLLQKELLEKIL